MKVRDLMSEDVITVVPSTSFKDAVRCMVTAEVSGLPVVGPDDSLLGVITDADVISKEAYWQESPRLLRVLARFVRGDGRRWVRKARGVSVRDVMTGKPVTLSPDDDIAIAARAMLVSGHRQLPVVAGGRLVGIIGRRDLLSVFLRSDEDIQREATELLGNFLWTPEDNHARVSVRDGVARVAGNVHYPDDREVVLAAVRSVQGVVAIEDELFYREERPVMHDVHTPVA